MRGDRRNDLLVGGEGDDLIVGRFYRDAMFGSGDLDPFIFSEGDFAGSGPNFAHSMGNSTRAKGDVIDLSSLDAVDSILGDQLFKWIGGAAFPGTRGELSFVEMDNFTMVQSDIYGDGVVDFAFRLDGLIDLQASDFLL